jgi:peptidoglycan/xylan/chitin deacetylase (PgdA/CDA1 family)
MFHDVKATGPVAGYAVSAPFLRGVIDLVVDAGTDGARDTAPLVLTFDDGLEGTFRNSLPHLIDARVSATLFVTTELLGRAGFMDAPMLRSWAANRMVVGSHGVTHRPLSLMSAAEARRELTESKARLEDLIGSAVTEFSFPGGNDSRALHAAALESGYRVVYTSRPAFTRLEDRVRPRFAVRATTDLSQVESLRQGHIPWPWWTDRLRWTVKRIVGAGTYRAIRRRLVGRTSPADRFVVGEP